RQTVGLFIAPLDAANGLGIVSISLAIAVGQLMWGLAQPGFGMLADRYGALPALVLGGLLIALGLVYRKQGRGGGLFVQNPGPDPLKTFLRGYLTGQKFNRSHFQELRNAIEPTTSRLAAERISDGYLKRLEANIEKFKDHAARMGKHPTRQRYLKMQDLIGDFHRTIAESTGNPLMMLVVDYLMDVLSSMATELYSDFSLSVAERIAEEHRIIYDALSRKDAHAAETYMHDHINWANKELGKLEKQ
ncbi:MAG: FCD domain-containing protein, partial [Dehalococcoidia bacterium]|nr:FCD domain-containing protein [Dehalococcoidia bacterium]